MIYFTNSVLNYIRKNIIRLQEDSAEDRRLLIMIPEMPEKALLSIADAISSYCIEDHSITLILKVASELTKNWTSQGYDRAKAQEWIDERGNLTYYRNLAHAPDKLSLVILCGVDRVTDSASLADFHTCDMDILWRNEMRGSFRNWIKAKLKSIGIDRIDNEDLKDIDKLLKPLISCGRGDLLKISDWLENINLIYANDIQHIQQTMLSSMDSFGLPNLIGFISLKKNKSLTRYIDKAGEFFSYTLFLEYSERDRATKAINKLIETIELGEDTDIQIDDENVRGPYSTGLDLLMSLRNYILTDEQEDISKLKKCDFITIVDKILKFRKKETRKKKESLKRISGSPVEMILTAMWQSMREYYQDKNIDQEAQITKIEIKYDRFKHDIEGSDDTEESSELAREYLARLIGGLDNIIEEHLQLINCENTEIKNKSNLEDNEIPCVHSRNAEPQLEFSVCIYYDSDDGPFRRRYAWRLPENHSYRIASDLLLNAKKAMDNTTDIWKLPVFHLPYYEELFKASSEDEIRSILLHCIRDSYSDQPYFTNLLSKEWLETGDKLLNYYKLLAEKYCLFICTTAKQGLYGALFNGDTWHELRKAYSEVNKAVSENPDLLQAPSVGMLLRSFLIIQNREEVADVTWHAEPYERSGIVTILHPALLEMLEAQTLYLISCFNYAVINEMKSDFHSNAFKPHIWRAYTDLSKMQTPLSGVLYNEEQNLDANVRGNELVHRIGTPKTGDATLSTRLRLNYNDSSEDDESVSDYEMFRETSESKLLLRLMLDYFRLHPHVRDAMSIAVYRNKDLQPVIAAVHHYLNTLSNPKLRYYVLNPERNRPYAISVTIFTGTSDDTEVSHWIEQWRERWEAAETENKYQTYRKCHFTIAHRLVENSGQKSFQKLIKDSFEADIAVFYDFIGAGNGVNRFENVDPFDITTRTSKFPILEKACCTISNPADKYKRSRVISNRQFILGSQHANMMHCLKNQSLQTGTIVIGTGDFAPWRPVIDALHKKTGWVICVDPSIDERLVKDTMVSSAKEREIIGFGSGVGTHGEDNYTISTEQFTLSDVHARLCASIHSLYAGAGWNSEECKVVATGVLEKACQLSGLSLVRATGVDDNYIRDFMAFSLTRKLLSADGKVLCDTLISLDAYRHWFDVAEDASRPDLLWLIAKVDNDNRIHIEMHLIECKMAQENEKYLVRAEAQINNGLKVLTRAFSPRRKDAEDERPDRRYWWMQLHRLIASKAEIKMRQKNEMLSALERLAEGDYDITWNASVFAFWIDSNDINIKNIGHWNPETANDVTANIYVFGSPFIKKLAKDNKEFPFNWNEFKSNAEKVEGNICDTIEDMELPPGDDEDDDVTKWDDENNIDEDDEDVNIENIEDVQIQGDSDTEDSDNVNDNSQIATTQTHDNKDNEKPTTEIPDRILLGKTIHGDRNVYWEFGHEELANRHMLIFGMSGMGKTYAIQCLLCEMARSGQNSLIVDYTDGFIPSKIEPSAKTYIKDAGQNFIRNAPLPINPFKAQVSHEAGMVFRDSADTIAKRVSAIFKNVYELGNQQFPVLIDAITEGIKQYKKGFDLNKLQDVLQSFIGDNIHSKSAVQTTISKLKPFISSNPFSEDNNEIGWNEVFNNEEIRNRVFQFHMVDKHSARALIEFVLWDLYTFVTSCGHSGLPKVVILDEVQNLDLGPEAPVAKYLTEGRKHGLGLITATQTVKGVGGVSDAKVSRLFQAEMKLFFKPTENELRDHAQLLHNAISTKSVNDWVKQLASLQKGECWILGRNLNEMTGKLILQAQRIRITSLEDRGFNE